MERDGTETVALMLESDTVGGAEIFLLNLGEELRRRGFGVLPVLPSWKSGWLGSQFLDRGFKPVTFSMRRSLDWECLKQLVDLLHHHDARVVHSHEFTMAVYGTAASRLLKRRHVITMHGNQWMTRALRRRLALRWAFAHSAATVAVSEDTRKHLQESMGLPPNLVGTIPNGIPAPSGDAAGPRREFDIGSEEVVLISVGNLTERKGHIVLLRALGRLVQEGCHVPWRLIIAGEGPERPELEGFLHDHGLEDRVHLPGHRTDISDLQAAADVMVMPSLWEGLPLAVLEGMFAGNAVLGSSASGIPEAVRDGRDGLLTPPGDDHALAAALRRVLEDQAFRRALGESALRRARERFSVERMVDDYQQLYFAQKGAPVNGASR